MKNEGFSCTWNTGFHKTHDIIGDNHPRNTGAGESADASWNQRRQAKFSNISSPAGRKLWKHSNLDTQGTNVCKPAECVGCNEARARIDVKVFLIVLKEVVGDKFVCYFWELLASLKQAKENWG